jgi:hypothetical protein
VSERQEPQSWDEAGLQLAFSVSTQLHGKGVPEIPEEVKARVAQILGKITAIIALQGAGVKFDPEFWQKLEEKEEEPGESW